MVGLYRDSNPLRLTILAAMSEDYTTAPQHLQGSYKNKNRLFYVGFYGIIYSDDSEQHWYLNGRHTINPMCQINDGIEETKHPLLPCHYFTECKRSLLASANNVLQTYGYSEVPGNNILQLLLCGDKNLPFQANALILI